MFTVECHCRQLKFIIRISFLSVLFKKKKQPMWTIICHALTTLKNLCDRQIATTDDLRVSLVELVYAIEGDGCI